LAFRRSCYRRRFHWSWSYWLETPNSRQVVSTQSYTENMFQREKEIKEKEN
jgi:hypothetical protein